MILLYGKFYVKKELTNQLLFERAIKWIKGMKNVPKSFLEAEPEQVDTFLYEEGAYSIEYANDEVKNLCAFCLKLEDDDDGDLWRTDLVLQETDGQGIMQIRLAKEQKRATSEIDQKFQIPRVLRELIKDGYGGNDNGLPIDGKPFIIDESNIDMGVRCILNADDFLMPIVYISKPFGSTEALLDVDELAVDLAGIAHVVVEKDSNISKIMKAKAAGKNPYAGAVNIIYGNDDSYKVLPSSNIKAGQFRWQIAHNLYRRTAMLNIPGEQSIHSIKTGIYVNYVEKDTELGDTDKRIKELELQLEQQKKDAEEAKQELTSFIEYFGDVEDENNKLKNDIINLQGKVGYYQNVVEKRGNGGGAGLKSTETEFYPGEINDVLLEVLGTIAKRYGDEEQCRRSYHIISDILKNNKVTSYRAEFERNIRNLIEKENGSSRIYPELEKLGFSRAGDDHQKVAYKGDERYLITIACTPSDNRTNSNTAHDALGLMFK